MANYPDWVMKVKKKGTYVNFTKGKYYLYAAHSERIKGTKKVKRICDGYLGRITEKDGLIPPKDKVTGDVIVYEYGLSTIIFNICYDIYIGFKKSFKSNASHLMIASTLSIIYGFYDSTVFNSSYLSILFPEININKTLTDKQAYAVKRGILMINHKLTSFFNDDKEKAVKYLSALYKIKINNKYYDSKQTTQIKVLIEKYKLKLENTNG